MTQLGLRLSRQVKRHFEATKRRPRRQRLQMEWTSAPRILVKGSASCRFLSSSDFWRQNVMNATPFIGKSYDAHCALRSILTRQNASRRNSFSMASRPRDAARLTALSCVRGPVLRRRSRIVAVLASGVAANPRCIQMSTISMGAALFNKAWETRSDDRGALGGRTLPQALPLGPASEAEGAAAS
jgi:hypothetical protein